jgi:hypothetical protein
MMVGFLFAKHIWCLTIYPNDPTAAHKEASDSDGSEVDDDAKVMGVFLKLKKMSKLTSVVQVKFTVTVQPQPQQQSTTTTTSSAPSSSSSSTTPTPSTSSEPIQPRSGCFTHRFMRSQPKAWTCNHSPTLSHTICHLCHVMVWIMA